VPILKRWMHEEPTPGTEPQPVPTKSEPRTPAKPEKSLTID